MVALESPATRNVDRIIKYRARHYIDGKFKPSKSLPDNPETTDQASSSVMIVSTYRQPRRELTDEEIQQIILKYGTGMSTYSLAEEYGCHRRTICNALKNAGVVVSNKASTKDPHLTAKVLQLKSESMRPSDIGKELGISESTVRRILRENNV